MYRVFLESTSGAGEAVYRVFLESTSGVGEAVYRVFLESTSGVGEAVYRVSPHPGDPQIDSQDQTSHPDIKETLWYNTSLQR